MSNSQMPGSLAESPKTGESSKPSKGKQTHVRGNREVAKLKELGDGRWGKDDTSGGGRTRSQKNEPWYPLGPLSWTASSKSKRPKPSSLCSRSGIDKGPDQPVTGDRNLGNPDPPDDISGNDQSGAVVSTMNDQTGEGTTVIQGKIPVEVTPPAVNSPKASESEIEAGLLGELIKKRKKQASLPDPEDWKTVSSGGSLRSSGTVNKETITNSKFFPPFMNNKGENNPTEDEVPEESVPSEGGSNSPEETNSAPEGGNDSPEGNVPADESGSPEGGINPPEGNQPEDEKTAVVEKSEENLPPDDEAERRMKYLRNRRPPPIPTQRKPKQPRKKDAGPPPWREFEKTNKVILLRKFHGKGPGSWSETNVRQLYQDTHHLEQCGNYKIDDIRSAQERVKGFEWDFKMPPKPRLPSPCSKSSLEYVMDQEEAHLQVSGVAIEPEQNYYEDEQRSEPESRLGRRTNWNDHVSTMQKLSMIGSSAQPRATGSRHINEVQLNY